MLTHLAGASAFAQLGSFVIIAASGTSVAVAMCGIITVLCRQLENR